MKLNCEIVYCDNEYMIIARDKVIFHSSNKREIDVYLTALRIGMMYGRAGYGGIEEVMLSGESV